MKTQLEGSHTPWICLAGRQDQAGIRKASGRYAEGTKSNYSDSDFHFSKPLDYTCHHNGTGVAERNGQAHWDDIKVLKIKYEILVICGVDICSCYFLLLTGREYGFIFI